MQRYDPAPLRSNALRGIAGVKDVAEERDGEWTKFTLRLDANARPGEEILKLAQQHQWAVRELHQKSATLEDVFADLTMSEA